MVTPHFYQQTFDCKRGFYCIFLLAEDNAEQSETAVLFLNCWKWLSPKISIGFGKKTMGFGMSSQFSVHFQVYNYFQKAKKKLTIIIIVSVRDSFDFFNIMI